MKKSKLSLFLICIFIGMFGLIVSCSTGAGSGADGTETETKTESGTGTGTGTETGEQTNTSVSYSVTYDKGDYGTLPESLKNGITVNENTVLNNEQLPSLIDEIAVFKGWFDGETKAVAGSYKVTRTVTLKAHWDDEATVSYSSLFDNLPESFDVKLNSKLTAENLTALEYTGYNFEGWYYSKDENNNGTGTLANENDEIKTDVTLYAKWSPKNDTAYKVEHYKEKADGSGYALVEADTQNLTGTTDAQTSAVANSYEHYTATEFSQVAIKNDGSSVVKIYYDIETVTLTFDFDGGKIGENTFVTRTGKYGASYEALTGTPEKTGYDFKEWSTSFPSTLQNITIKALYTPRTDTKYKVIHKLQTSITDWRGNTIWDTKDSEDKTGTTGQLTEAAANTYEHYTARAITQKDIAGDGTTIVEVYYDAEDIILTFDLNGGKFEDGKTGTVEYKLKYDPKYLWDLKNPTKENFIFIEWEPQGDASKPYLGSSKYQFSLSKSAAYTAKWSTSKIIAITIREADINVSKEQVGNTITFTADDGYDSYIWTLDDVEESTSRAYTIDTTSMKGTYTLSLEAEKNGRWYSYYAQIKVE